MAETRIAETMAGEIHTHWDITMNMTDEAWHRMIGVHLNGTFFCTREALKLMSRVNRGAIVNLSSVAALSGLDTVPHYSAAKGGILSFTRAVAREVGSRGIRVNAICPGYIETPMTVGDLAAHAEGPRQPHAARALGTAGGDRGDRALPRIRRQRVLHGPVALAERRARHWRLSPRGRR